jgi:hydroxymethylpyrimidine pyrophosphatase-like HAD family hydrolase
MDGTLLNDRGCLIKDVDGKFFIDCIELFEKSEKLGRDIVLVSGRNKLQLRYNAQLMGVINYIPELGCELVHDLGEKVYVTFDTSNYKYDITRGGKDLVRIIELLKFNFPRKIDSRIEWSMERSYNALFLGDVDADKANSILAKNGYGGLSLVDNGFSKLMALNLDVEHLRIYNIVPKGVDKSSAIKLDKEIRKLQKNNCIALGDSSEDLKMAKEVHAFFLMKDTIERDSDILESLRNYDNVYVTSQSMNRGWAEVIKCLSY